MECNNINPSNIVINDEGKVKIIPGFPNNSQINTSNNYTQAILNNSKKCFYLSPILFKYL
jgi:hypothetical protein